MAFYAAVRVEGEEHDGDAQLRSKEMIGRGRFGCVRFDSLRWEHSEQEP
jgi:hypothetical protein